MKNLVLISGKLSSRNNEILCLICASAQNDIGQEPVISREPCSGDREIPGILFVRIHSVKISPKDQSGKSLSSPDCFDPEESLGSSMPIAA